jgi:hypothetical protein
MPLVSRVNQPERVTIRSDDDDTNPSNQFFYQFSVNLPTPVLAPFSADIIRATIPNAQINIPDYQLIFWYYKLDSETQVPTSTQLKCIRLFPSWWKNPDAFSTYTVNRYFLDPSDFVSALNNAVSNDDVTYNPYWVNGDITFAFDSTTKKISFSGNDAGKWYAPAGYNDPHVKAALLSNTIRLPMYKGDGTIATTIAQPYAIGYPLNLRCGFSMSGISRGVNSYSNGSSLIANPQNWPEGEGTPIPGDSYPNLVYTACVYLYTNILNGSSSTSNNRQNLLAVVPVNSAPLGITNYVSAMLTKQSTISQTIQNITIEMRDDADEPYNLPDNAQVNVEIYFDYHK